MECCSEGKPWLLLHGLAGSSANWLKFMDLVEKKLDGIHLIAPDLLGHGESSAPKIKYSASLEASIMSDFMANLGYDRFSVIGNSLGGWIAMLLSLQGRVEAEILVDSGGMRLPTVSPLDPKDLDEAMALLSKIFRASSWKTREVASRLMSGRSGSKGYVLQSFLRSEERYLSWEDISRIEVPTLIVWGSEDGLIPLQLGRLLASRIRGSKMIILNGVGHEPMIEDPEGFFIAVSGWMKYS